MLLHTSTDATIKAESGLQTTISQVFALAGNWHSSCILTIGRPFYLHGFIEPHSHTITMAILNSVSEFKSFFKFFSF